MDKKEYVDEIKLIQEQNDVEFEIYPLAAELIAPFIKNLSKRYVFARRLSPLGQIYYGISSFPDIAIVERDFKNTEHSEINETNWSKIKGCVEVKAYNKTLYKLQDLSDFFDENKNLTSSKRTELGQLIGEILWYRKVLYTNGVCWKLFEFNPNEHQKSVILDLVKERIDADANKTNFEWWSNNDLKCIFSEEQVITEEVIAENCIEEWGDFNEKIKEIEWIHNID